jgi:hypothetical protein
MQDSYSELIKLRLKPKTQNTLRNFTIKKQENSPTLRQ